jgi:hypothetical protein
LIAHDRKFVTIYRSERHRELEENPDYCTFLWPKAGRSWPMAPPAPSFSGDGLEDWKVAAADRTQMVIELSWTGAPTIARTREPDGAPAK